MPRIQWLLLALFLGSAVRLNAFPMDTTTGSPATTSEMSTSGSSYSFSSGEYHDEDEDDHDDDDDDDDDHHDDHDDDDDDDDHDDHDDEHACTYLNVGIKVGYQMEADCGLCTCTADKGLVCDECDGCNYKGTHYRHLDTWWERCNECECYNATIRCHEKTCPDTCDYYGETVVVGYEWEEDCNTCTCTNDGVECTDNVCSCTYDGVSYDNHVSWEVSPGDWCICLDGTILGTTCLFQQILDEASENSVFNTIFG